MAVIEDWELLSIQYQFRHLYAYFSVPYALALFLKHSRIIVFHDHQDSPTAVHSVQ